MKRSRSKVKKQVVSDREPETAVSELGVRLNTVALRSLAYREVGPQPRLRPDQQPQRINLDLELTGELRLHNQPDGRPPAVELSLKAVARPDVAIKPIEVEVQLSAVFTRVDPTSFDDLLRFTNAAGARLLFPYLREIVSSVTSRGLYGPVLIDPVTVESLMPDEKLHEIAADWRTRTENTGPSPRA
jgi:preprotein translocase subunit SecB